MPNLGPLEIAIIAGIVVLLFGVGRISGLGRELGSSIREFRRGVREEKEGHSSRAVHHDDFTGANQALEASKLCLGNVNIGHSTD